MRVSQQVLEWQIEGRIETRRSDILRFLEKRYKTPIPNELASKIEKINDMSVLEMVIDAAAVANTFDEFRAAIQS